MSSNNEVGDEWDKNFKDPPPPDQPPPRRRMKIPPFARPPGRIRPDPGWKRHRTGSGRGAPGIR